jgi:hypothetical protein
MEGRKVKKIYETVLYLILHKYHRLPLIIFEWSMLFTSIGSTSTIFTCFTYFFTTLYPMWTSLVWHVCRILFVFVLGLYSIYERKHVAFGFWTWLLHVTWCILFQPISSKWQKFICLYVWLKSDGILAPHFLTPYISCRSCVFFPQLGYCDRCCNKHGYASVFVWSRLKFLQVYP